MRESGETMECGIFDFCKVFSRAFGEEEDGVGESYSGRLVTYTPDLSPRPVNNTLPPDFPFRPSKSKIQFIH